MKNLIKKILSEIEVPHHYQPTGHSCGPTCLKMVHDFFVGDRFKVSDICRACGTDWVVGTPPERMAKGLQYMGIQYVEHIDDENPFQALKDAIDKGHPCIIRTITQGTPHWIIAVDYDHDTFMINDPWLGRILYDSDELNDIWHMRNYFFYEVTNADKDVYPEDLESDEEFNEKTEEDYMSEDREWWEDWSDEEISYFIHELHSVYGVSANVQDVQDFNDEVITANMTIEKFAEEFVKWLEKRKTGQLELQFPEDAVNETDDKSVSKQVEISHFESEDEIIQALRVGLKVFEGQMDPKTLIEYLSKSADWDISVKATYEGKVVGFYLLAESQMPDYILHYMVRDYKCYSPEECIEKHPNSLRVNPLDFQDLSGVEGVALGVDPNYKGLGIGKKLIDYSQNLPYDYIWGQQYEHLQNIDHWTKRREIAAYFPGLYLTYQML